MNTARFQMDGKERIKGYWEFPLNTLPLEKAARSLKAAKFKYG
jgi:hypothetical protein